MKLTHAKAILQEERYLDALKTVTEAEAEVDTEKTEKVVVTPEDVGSVEDVLG